MIPIITILGHFSVGWSQTHPSEVGKCYYPCFETGNWGTDGSKSQRAYLAEQSLETGSQPLLLLCRGSATESSYSSLPLLYISICMYFTDMKPSVGSIARSTCSSPWVLPPPSQMIHCGSHRLLDCMESGTSTSQVCSHHVAPTFCFCSTLSY